MQTFLPYRDFRRSAAVLDPRRLGKQRVETLQILRALTFDDYGWRNHPAVTMWAGATDALVCYGLAVTDQWRKAGFSDTVAPQLIEFLGDGAPRTQRKLAEVGALPPWLGARSLHRSHQAALVRKDPAHYGAVFPAVDPALPYVWPAPGEHPANHEAITGWVVRAEPAIFPALVDRRLVGVSPHADETPETPAGTGARSTKRRRQIRAFVEQIAVGDRVVVPDGQTLHVGEVVGDYEWLDDAPFELHHARRVRWITAVHRSDLRRPVHLQDPRTVFSLRGEPVLTEVD